MSHFDAPAPLLPEIFRLHGHWRSHHEAVVCDDRRLNWHEFVTQMDAFAAALLGQGIEPGDRVAVLMNNDLEMVITLYGIMAAGCVSVPINLSVSDAAVNGMIEDARATALVTSPDQAARMDAHLSGVTLKLKLSYSCTLEGWLDWPEFLAGAVCNAPANIVQADDEFNIIYSSGTTGLPKGIVHTHRGRRDWAYDLAIALRYHTGARTLLSIGLYSNISWVGMLCTLLAGGTLVVQRKFSPAEMITLVEQEVISHAAMVPIQYQQIMDEVDRKGGAARLSSLQALMSCGSPLHKNLKQRIFDTCPCGIIELYGLTEGIITTLDPEDARGHLSSVGKPLLGTDIRIVGEDDQPLDAGEAGEIVSRGRITMPGYLDRPEANEASTWVDATGRRWLRSGDIGKVDEEGFLYIVDRKKDMILSGGQNIYPQDIEAVIYEHSDVIDVAVIAAQSDRWGETPIALIVSAESGLCTDDVKTWCNERLGRQQRVADVIQVEALPRNPNGKILKRELREHYGKNIYHSSQNQTSEG